MWLPTGSSERPRRFRVHKFRDVEMVSRYGSITDTLFLTVLGEGDSQDSERAWTTWKQALTKASSESVGMSSDGAVRHAKCWWTPEIRQAIRERRQVFLRVKDLPEEHWKPYFEAREKVRKLVPEAKAESWRRF